MDEKIYTIIGSIIGTIIGYFIGLLIQRLAKKIKSKDHILLLTSELSDLHRHCLTNLKVLDEMNLSKGIPSRVHFEKLKIMESTVLFSQEVYLNVSSKYTSQIHRTRLEVRNINIEVDFALSLLNTKPINRDLLAEYINYLKDKNIHVVKKFKQRLENINNGTAEFDSSKTSPKIIYE